MQLWPQASKLIVTRSRFLQILIRPTGLFTVIFSLCQAYHITCLSSNIFQQFVVIWLREGRNVGNSKKPIEVLIQFTDDQTGLTGELSYLKYISDIVNILDHEQRPEHAC